MSWQLLVTVFTFGGIGAVVRGSVIFILAMPAVFVFPLPTLMINIVAALLGGFVLSITLPDQIGTALSVGLVGGMGTLSAFAGDILNHYFDKRHRKKMFLLISSYVMLTAITGVLFAALGSAFGNFVLQSYSQNSEAALFLEQSRMLQESLRQDAAMHEHIIQENHAGNQSLINPELDLNQSLEHMAQPSDTPKPSEALESQTNNPSTNK